MTDVVEENKVVLFKYTLKNSEGEQLDASGERPLPYLHGADNIVPGLENAMTGKTTGDAFSVVIPPENGYGERNAVPEQEVPRQQFPEEAEIQVGMPFMLEAPDGSMVTIWITGVDSDTIKFDTNHPLAGEELHFDVEITGVREPTEEELEHGHPHGPTGEATH